MNYRRLGHSNIEVSEICMGTGQLSTQGNSLWGPQDPQESIMAVQEAIDLGVNFFDTAEDYADGASEELLGKALGQRRRDVILATKVSSRHIAWRRDLQKACEESLHRLGTDYIDLYQVHFPNPDVALDQMIEGLEDLKAEGKIREYGVSNFGLTYLNEMAGRSNAISNQLPYSLLWRAIEYEVLPLSAKLSLSVLAYSPLMQGLLSGKYQSPSDLPSARMLTRIFGGNRDGTMHGEAGCEGQAAEALRRIHRICEGLGEPMNAVALAWLLAQGGVASAIVGARSEEQVRQNVRAAEIRLDADTLRELAKATDDVKRAVGRNCDMWKHESRMERHAVEVS